MSYTQHYRKLLSAVAIALVIAAGSITGCGTQNDDESVIHQAVAHESQSIDSSAEARASAKKAPKQVPTVVSYVKNEPVTI
jgi:hypothetical protein